ncbi:galactose oxidase [Carboxylicivirga sp. M1479]|uniref:Kelch repeat-containing protein n=1 Tax=Carboxylicivirga sp. M1479 TaxID=2594476 RepID=UPI001C8F2C21|nr:galactose oxidase [Carboxylicivirga sp. M1479]
MINMNQLSILLFISFLLFTSCSSSTDDEELLGNWVERGSFEGVPRTEAVAFVIDNYAYVGTGYDGVEDERLKDFWRYDSEKDFWTQVAPFEGVARNGAVAFTANGMGYVTTGNDGKNKLNDNWAYDVASNSWSEKAAFAGSARYGAVSFSLNNKGFVGTGYDGNILKDFWAYDPLSDSWEQKVSIGGKKRRDAVAFVIDEKAYVCTGSDNGQYLDDLWQYDASADAWTQKRDIGKDANEDESYDDEYEIVGINGVAFSINGLGYVSTGGAGAPGSLNWEYNPDSDVWEELSNFEGSPRYSAVAFVIDNEPFIATGNSAGYYFDDVWTFNPNEEQDDND